MTETNSYDIRQPGMTSYATAATLDEARTLLAEARGRGLHARCYVDGHAVDGLLDRDDASLAYDILRAFGPDCSDGADAESVALAERATDGQGVRAYGAEGAGLSDDQAAIAGCLRMLALCGEMSDEGDED